MTVSKLIKELTDLEKSYGNLDVFIGNIKEVSEVVTVSTTDRYGEIYPNSRIELL